MKIIVRIGSSKGNLLVTHVKLLTPFFLLLTCTRFSSCCVMRGEQFQLDAYRR